MSGPILVAYGTKHGSTREVAETIAETLEQHGLEVMLRSAARVADLTGFGGVVLGGAIYMGRWHPDAAHFLAQHRRALSALPVAVFSMGPKTMDAHDADESLVQLARSLDKVPDVQPFAVALFGGVIDPETLRFPLSRMPASDARDWTAIRAWASHVAATFDCGKPAAESRERRSELQRSHR